MKYKEERKEIMKSISENELFMSIYKFGKSRGMAQGQLIGIFSVVLGIIFGKIIATLI